MNGQREFLSLLKKVLSFKFMLNKLKNKKIWIWAMVFGFCLIVFLMQTNEVLALTAGNTSGYAWGENIGWISLNCDHTSLGLPLGDDTCASQEYGVLTTNDGIYGYAWSENIGWISLNCSNDASCGTVDYKVTNNNGVLGGYAWSETAGWIDFNPVGDEGVVIDPATGVFSNYAWGENIGWISFSDGASYQGKTAWRGILGQLTKPTNLHHTNNPESPLAVWWQWDQVFVPLTTIETSYTVYMKDLVCAVEPCTYYTNTGTHALDYNPTSAGTSLSVDYNDNPLSFNAQYTIKVMAVYPGYTNSDFSDPSSAYTSAASPVNLLGTIISNSQIKWTWESGGGESGFYAQNTQGGSKDWTTDLFWDQTGLSCGQNYILQVKAKNANFDGCVSDCGGDETALQSSDPVVINTLTAPGSAQILDQDITDTSIKLTWTDNSNEEGFIIERAQGDPLPGDDYSQIATVSADITFYIDNMPPLVQNTHYWYRVKAYSRFACDSGYATANAWTKGPKLAINPTTYPIGYLVDNYNFGVLEPNETKSISMLICNLGDADLTISSASIDPTGAFSSDAPTVPFTLRVDPGYYSCDNNLAGQAKKQVVITFTSQSSCDPDPITSQANFILLNNDENKTVFLKGVCQESPVGEGKASENVIYDGRIMANPPPAFVEFLEKLQFSEKIKPR